MMRKYKVHEIAKDFSLASKDVLTLVSGISKEEKKYSSVLTDDELNVVFDVLSQQHSVGDFTEYFEEATQKREARVKEEEQARLAQPQQAQPQQAQPQQAQPQQAQPQQAQPQQAQPQQAQPQQAQPQQVQPQQAQTPQQPRPQQPLHQNSQQNQQPARPATFQPAAPNAQANNFNKPPIRPQTTTTQNAASSQTVIYPFHSAPTQKPKGVAPSHDKEVHHVDTKTVFVDSDKYSDKYENVTSKANNSNKGFDQRKQKITQKSRQLNKPSFARKETDSEKLRRLQLEKARKQQLKITIGENISVNELAAKLKKNVAEVVKKLMTSLGVMAAASEVIDYDTAALIAIELGAKVEREVVVTIEERIIDQTEDTDDNLITRSPIVVVMGHVDHGKTSLLDAIRKTSVVSGEAGGITQHIGAYRVSINDREITFLDTPGHAAFTSMRARGAQVTDVAIIVVAADDGIMPQTVEAINHAKAAGVSIIVAINKMDKPGANPERIKQELTEYELVPEEWGGDIPCVPVSAITKKGIDDLLEIILLVADLKDLKANPDRAAKGTVIESRLDKGRGTIATLLVQNGTLHVGDIIVAGNTVGRVRAMTDDKGKKVEIALPSCPVEITGLSEVPLAGDVFDAVTDERLARELVERRISENKEEKFKTVAKVTLDNLFEHLQEGEIKELPIIVKADVAGSVEAITQSLHKITNEEVRVSVIHSGVGGINESDVMLAQASNAIVVGFNVRPDPVAALNADNVGVDIRLYRVIYDCIDEITSAMKGMLTPKTREVLLGRAEVRLVYKITGVGTIAGSYVLDGKITRNALIRVLRNNIIIADDKLSSLKRFKDDAKEVMQGYECGMGLNKFNDLKEGDIFEAYIIEEYQPD